MGDTAETSLRRRWDGIDAVLLVASALLVGAASAVLARMLVDAWDSGGIVYGAVTGTLGALGLSKAAAVATAVAFVVTLFLFFLLDSSKQMQALTLVPLFPVFYVAVTGEGRWYAIQWGAQVPFLAVGLLVGSAVALAGRNVSGNVREFPAAANGLHAVLAGVAAIGFLEYHLASGAAIVEARYLWRDLGAVLVVAVLLGSFTRYRNPVTMVIVSADGDGITEANVTGGLYQTVRQIYGDAAVTTESHEWLLRASNVSSWDDLTDVVDTGGRSGREDGTRRGFQFRPVGWFSQTVAVGARALPATRFTEYHFNAIDDAVTARNRTRNRFVDRTKRYLRLAVPKATPDETGTGRRIHNAVLGADVVVCAVHYPDIAANDSAVETFARLYRSFGDDSRTRLLFVVTGGSTAMDEYTAEEGGPQVPLYDTDFRSFVRDALLDGSDAWRGRQPDAEDIVVVDREASDDAETGSRLKGSERVLETLF
ncbi:hypothetical protein [Halosimplex halophilum]|uniref:hypothetical protein n=1 Tax=Halosimplex halophilum TaxID=2559572 RepID=UPI00107F0D76|nr:hypothetical protein [Halosimplex halophilum]